MDPVLGGIGREGEGRGVTFDGCLQAARQTSPREVGGGEWFPEAQEILGPHPDVFSGYGPKGAGYRDWVLVGLGYELIEDRRHVLALEGAVG